LAERVDTCRRHLDFSIQWKGDRKGLFEMRRHYTAYFKGLDHFKSFRTQLVEAESHEAVLEILHNIQETYQMEPA
jgi:tRNA-dihydrouridine synthase